MKAPPLQENIYIDEPRHIAYRLIMSEIIKRGHEVERVGSSLIANVEGAFVFFDNAYSSLMPESALRLAENKAVTKVALEEAGLQVANGRTFKEPSKDEAWSFCQKFSSVVIKPTSGLQGRGVTVGVKTKMEFEIAWNHAGGPTGKTVLIEEEFQGEEARYLVIGNSCVSVYKKTPPFVTGDGRSTIKELIDKKNYYRDQHPHFASRLIYLTDSRIKYIQKQGFQLNSIPEAGSSVYIDSMSSISSGGETHEITDTIHEEMKQIAERAALAVPGGDILGLDIMSKNHSLPPREKSYIIVEINTRPGVGGHNKPAYGRAANVIPPIVANVEKVIRLRRKFIEGSERSAPPGNSVNISGINFSLGGLPARKAGLFRMYDLSDGKLITYRNRLDESGPLTKRFLSHKISLRIIAQEAGFDVIPGQTFSVRQRKQAIGFAKSLISAAITPLHHDYSDTTGQIEKSSLKDAWKDALSAETSKRRRLQQGVFVSPRLDAKRQIKALFCFGRVLFCTVQDGESEDYFLPGSKLQNLLAKLAYSLPYPNFFEALIYTTGPIEDSAPLYLARISPNPDLDRHKGPHEKMILDAMATVLISYRSKELLLE